MLKNLVSIKALLVEEGTRPEAEEETKLDVWGRQQKAQSVPFGMGNVVATEGAILSLAHAVWYQGQLEILILSHSEHTD